MNIFILLIIIIVIAINSINFSEYLAKRKRIKKIEQFKLSSEYKFRHIDSAIFDLYKNKEYYKLLDIQDYLKDENELNIILMTMLSQR